MKCGCSTSGEEIESGCAHDERRERAMDTPSVKEEAKRLIETLPEDSTWEDLMHRIYVRQAIEAGLKDSEAGRVVEVEEVRSRFNLPE